MYAPTLCSAFSQKSALQTADCLLPQSSQPNRYIGDHLTSAESANLADLHTRDHWMFGAG